MKILTLLNLPKIGAEDYEESDSDEEPDDSQEVGFSEGDDVDNADSQYDDADYENVKYPLAMKTVLDLMIPVTM